MDLDQLRSRGVAKVVPAFYTAQLQLKRAKKDSENPYFKSKYADLASVWDACHEAIHNNELCVTQTMMPCGIDGSGTAMVTTLWHITGEFISSVMPLLLTQATPQAQGSAITYARRYCLAAMMGIMQEDDDGNAASQPPAQTNGAKSLVDWVRLKDFAVMKGWEASEVSTWIKTKREEGNNDVQIFKAGMQKFEAPPQRSKAK